MTDKQEQCRYAKDQNMPEYRCSVRCVYEEKGYADAIRAASRIAESYDDTDTLTAPKEIAASIRALAGERTDKQEQDTAPQSHVLPPVVTGQMKIEPGVTAADLGVNAGPADDEIGPYEQALRDAVEPFLDWLEMRESGAHIQEVRDGLIGVEDVLPDDLVVLGAHPRADKDQGVLTMGHFRRLQNAYDGNAAPAPQPKTFE